MSMASSLTKQLCALGIVALWAANAAARIEAAEAVAEKPEVSAAEKEAAKEQKQSPAEKKSTVTVSGIDWRTDYNAAYQAAKRSKRMLLINLTSASSGNVQSSVDAYIAANPTVQKRLQNVERLRLPVDAEITVDGKSQRLLSFAAFTQLQGGPGFVLLDLQHEGTEHYGHAVNVLPYASGKYYHWQNNHLSVVLDLPPGTLTQRTMIWAVRTHPEGPQSTYGTHHPTLAQGAASHSNYQASLGQQGHQNFGSRFHQLSGATGGPVSEVVAESWPGQNMIDSCIDCVRSWRGSSGHWRGVAGRHRAFGYDIRRGRNGIWYGTGIFAD
jgi:hypothetical protein